MRKRRFGQVLLLVFVASLFALGTISAQPGPANPMLASLPGGGWYTAFQVQNISDQDGTLSLLALRVQGDSDESYQNSYPFRAKRLLTYNPGLPPNFEAGGNRIGFQPELPDGFIGSVALSADVPIVAVTNLANYPLGSVGIAGGHASAQYQGISGDDADTEIRFPLVKRNFYGNTTTFYIQAAGSDANVTIRYNMADGNEVTEGPVFVAANRMVVFTPPDSVKCASGGSNKCLGAATVTADAPVAGVYVEHPEAANPAQFALSTRGFTTADLGTTLFAPITKNDFYGGTTGLSVQNAGDAATDITVVFTVARVQPGSDAAQAGVSPGQQYTETIQNVQPGSAAVFTPYRGTFGNMPKGVFASAKVTSTGGQPLVAIVNEIHPVEGQQVYAAFSESRASRKVAAPLVKEAFHGAGTGIAVQNTGDNPTDVTIYYTDIGGTTYTLGPVTLPAGQGTSFYQVSNPARGFPWVGTPLPKGSLTAVIIESSAEPIVAVIQERDEDPNDSNGQLDSMNYEGFPIE